jgi:hypothetical protein
LGLIGRAGEGGERVAPARHRAQQRREPRLEAGRRVGRVGRLDPDDAVEHVAGVADQRGAVAQQRVRPA